jgi:4-coumarate--CoA ligase
MVVMFCKDQNLRKKDLATVRYVMVGAAPLSPELVKQFIKILPHGVTISQGQLYWFRNGWKLTNPTGYGMTETSVIVCMPPLDTQQVIDGSTGQVVPGTKIKIVGADGKLVGYDQPGELHVIGPQTYVARQLHH